MQGSIARWLAAALMATVVAAPAAHAQGGPKPTDPAPGTPEYGERDTRNIADAYGRQTGQQLAPAYIKALREEHGEVTLNQLTQQMATPNRLAITPGNVFPGWNGGNPLRRGWSGRRGLRVPVSYTNRYGALIRGNVLRAAAGRQGPVHRREAQAAVSRRRHHHRARSRGPSGCTSGSRRTSPSAATSCSPTTSRARARARRSRTTARR